MHPCQFSVHLCLMAGTFSVVAARMLLFFFATLIYTVLKLIDCVSQLSKVQFDYIYVRMRITVQLQITNL